MKPLDPHNINLFGRTLLDGFKLIVFCTQHLWGSKYAFPHAELTQQPISSSQRRETQRPRTVLFTSHEYFHFETSSLSNKCWYNTCCSNKAHSTTASPGSASKRSQGAELSLAGDSLDPPDQHRSVLFCRESCSTGKEEVIFFFQHRAENQICTSRAMRMRTSLLPEVRDQQLSSTLQT